MTFVCMFKIFENIINNITRKQIFILIFHLYNKSVIVCQLIMNDLYYTHLPVMLTRDAHP